MPWRFLEIVVDRLFAERHQSFQPVGIGIPLAVKVAGREPVRLQRLFIVGHRLRHEFMVDDARSRTTANIVKAPPQFRGQVIAAHRRHQPPAIVRG